MLLFYLLTGYIIAASNITPDINATTKRIHSMPPALCHDLLYFFKHPWTTSLAKNPHDELQELLREKMHTFKSCYITHGADMCDEKEIMIGLGPQQDAPGFAPKALIIDQLQAGYIKIFLPKGDQKPEISKNIEDFWIDILQEESVFAKSFLIILCARIGFPVAYHWSFRNLSGCAGKPIIQEKAYPLSHVTSIFTKSYVQVSTKMQ